MAFCLRPIYKAYIFSFLVYYIYVYKSDNIFNGEVA